MMVSIRVPGSKSVALRVLVASAMAAGTSRLVGLPVCDDTSALAAALALLGVAYERADDGWSVVGLGGRLAPGPARLDAGESGAAARFLLALPANRAGRYTIRLGGRLPERPMGELLPAISQLGATVRRVDRRHIEVEADPKRAPRHVRLATVRSRGAAATICSGYGGAGSNRRHSMAPPTIAW